MRVGHRRLNENIMSKVLDHGYINYIEHWGSDERIIEAARMSVDKGFLGWEPGVCPTCNGLGDDNEKHKFNKCKDCNGTGKIAGDKKLLRHLWVKKHTTPFEMAGMVIEVQAPIMVFREWHRHRTQSYNEMSARYTPLPDLNYIPTVERLMMNAGTTNKQAGTVAGSDVLTEDKAAVYRLDLEIMYIKQQKLYERALADGVPKELARMHLPVGRYSRMRASANLLNWLKFLTLRMADDAQYEIRVYAIELCGMLQARFPRTMELFLEGK